MPNAWTTLKVLSDSFRGYAIGAERGPGGSGGSRRHTGSLALAALDSAWHHALRTAATDRAAEWPPRARRSWGCGGVGAGGRAARLGEAAARWLDQRWQVNRRGCHWESSAVTLPVILPPTRAAAAHDAHVWHSCWPCKRLDTDMSPHGLLIYKLAHSSVNGGP